MFTTIWFSRKIFCLFMLSLTVSAIGWRAHAGRWVSTVKTSNWANVTATANKLRPTALPTSLLSRKDYRALMELHVSTEQELRDALTAASGVQNGDTVVFDANITLSRDLPAVQDSITINGNGHFLDGAGAYRGLFVYAGTVTIQNLTIQNAVAQGGASGGGGGGAGLGGALFVNTGASVTLSGVSFNGNAAKGGNRASGFFAGGCSRAITYTLTIAPTVVPIAECIINNGNGTFTARFGYDNSTGGVVTILVGINNFFSVGAQNRNQPTVFQVGRVTNAFTVTFQSNGSDASSWLLKGPDNVLRSVILTATSPPCP